MMMEGWLTKRRDHMNLIWSTLRYLFIQKSGELNLITFFLVSRYFILDGNQLRYYKKRGDLVRVRL